MGSETTEQGKLSIPDAGKSARAPVVGDTVLTWPTKLPGQVALIKKLIPQDSNDPATLSAAFGKANKKRQEQIEGILETLHGLGLL